MKEKSEKFHRSVLGVFLIFRFDKVVTFQKTQYFKHNNKQESHLFVIGHSTSGCLQLHLILSAKWINNVD